MNKELLYKYFEGKCTAFETKQVLQWYTNAKPDANLDQEITELFETTSNKSKEYWNKKEVFDNILSQIEDVETFEEKKHYKKLPTHNTLITNGTLLKIAGVVSFILMVCGFLWIVKHNRYAQKNIEVAKCLKTAYITKLTTKGQKSKLKLPDGTQVMLNAGSKLWFTNTFSVDNERIVYLDGEAFFEVVRDTTRPFIIHAHETVTRVLGTSFNINAYSNKVTSVAVVSGEVLVNNLKNENTAQIYLSPGEKAICDKNNASIVKTLFSYDKEIVWKDGTLTFYKEDFETVAKKLEMWYGKKVIINKVGIRNDFTGTYHNKSLKTVLEGMSYVLGFNYTIKKDKIIIN